MLGDGCELRHAAAIAGVEMGAAARLAEGLVRAEVLAAGDPPRFVHPVIRAALEASLGGGERDRAHRCAARLLHADGAPPGQVAAHLAGVRPAGDGWVLARLREAARAAMDSGAPQAAAGLLGRALAEPPPQRQRAGVLREAARAEASAGRETACVLLEEALRLVSRAAGARRDRARGRRGLCGLVPVGGRGGCHRTGARRARRGRRGARGPAGGRTGGLRASRRAPRGAGRARARPPGLAPSARGCAASRSRSRGR